MQTGTSEHDSETGLDTPAEDVAAPKDVAPPNNAEADAPVVPDLAYARDWMSQLLTEHAGSPVRLVDITIPRSHDTGTYLLTSCTFGATACNVQTQHLPMKEQLEAGIRVFDVRPTLLDDGYFSHHTTECGGLGCAGDSIQSILAQTRAFADAHAELVILQMGHYCNTSAKDDALVALFAAELGDRLYTEGAGETEDFIHRDLHALIPPAGGLGTVLVTWSGLADTADLRAQGRFTSSYFPTAGGWSNKQHLDELVTDQLDRYAKFDHDGSALFEFSWTMTMDTDLAVACFTDEDPRSIESMAAETNGVLASTLDALIEQGAIEKGKIPHILSVDYADVFVTDQCIRLSKLNLQ